MHGEYSIQVKHNAQGEVCFVGLSGNAEQIIDYIPTVLMFLEGQANMSAKESAELILKETVCLRIF